MRKIISLDSDEFVQTHFNDIGNDVISFYWLPEGLFYFPFCTKKHIKMFGYKEQKS